MVDFAGYDMPVNYPQGIIKEHLHTRAAAGLFDVSHMGQIRVRGDNIADHLETLLPVDLVGLQPGQQKYGLFLNENGGVLDDLMAINLENEFLLVVNAACKHDDLSHLEASLGARLQFSLESDLALLALQGPKAAEVIATILDTPDFDLDTFKFMQVAELSLADCRCLVSRSGYSGEDGFEISVDARQAEELARKLLQHEAVQPVGLGARDSLRLEAGLCLYGQDLDPQITPVEAGLNWAISPARRRGGAREGGFPGDQVILEQMENGCSRKRVGLLPEGRAPMRAGTPLFDLNQNPAGVITSGGFSPSLGHPVSMGYVPTGMATPDTALLAEVRGKMLPLKVTALPFVQQQYHR